MPFIKTSDDFKLYFEEAGSGIPIVFVHEFGGDIRSWEPQIRYFSRNYRVIVFNARGYPPSEVPKDDTSYGQKRKWLLQKSLLFPEFLKPYSQKKY